MSAYIVENNTIDRILSAINSNRDIGDWIKRTIKRETGDDLDTAEGLTLFGRKLLDMNEKAVNQRYKGDDNVGVFVDYRFRLVLNSAVDGFKALACLMYQCSEGDVPNSDFYKLMDKIKGAMAEDIVHKMPEWTRAKWG